MRKEKICNCVLKQHYEAWVAPDSENQEPELHYVSMHNIGSLEHDPRKYLALSSFFHSLYLL